MAGGSLGLVHTQAIFAGTFNHNRYCSHSYIDSCVCRKSQRKGSVLSTDLAVATSWDMTERWTSFSFSLNHDAKDPMPDVSAFSIPTADKNQKSSR